MRRFAIFATGALIMVLSVLLTTWTIAQAREHDYMMVGVVVAEEKVALEVEDQIGQDDAVVVSRALAPDDSWIVVHLDDDGMPGKRIGLLQVERGESSDLVVELDEPVTTPNVIVALHADRGEAGTFEFDMEMFRKSPDKPYFVGFDEVARVVAIAEFGVKADRGDAAIELSDQRRVVDSLFVSKAVAPAGSWVVVHLDDNGMPGMRVGLKAIPKGESVDFRVDLDAEDGLTDTLFVAIHADRGVIGEFEFDMDRKLESPDQPYFVEGEEVAASVMVR